MELHTFIYPKRRHIRTEKTKSYTSYTSYRPFVEREFSQKCVYCCSPDWLDPAAVFTIDHYKPKEYHPELECEYSNLFYCCHACNSRKGAHPYIKDRRTKKLSVVLHWIVPNPCDHVMTDHIRVNSRSLEIVPQTEDGGHTIRLLDLNSRHRVRHRERHENDIRRLKLLQKSILQQERRLAAKLSRLKPASHPWILCTQMTAELTRSKQGVEADLAYLVSGATS